VCLYLQGEQRAHVLAQMVERLRPGGFLVIGGKDHLPNGFCEKNCLIEVDYRAEEIGLGDVRCIFQKSGGAALNSKAADRRGRAPCYSQYIRSLGSEPYWVAERRRLERQRLAVQMSQKSRDLLKRAVQEGRRHCESPVTKESTAGKYEQSPVEKSPSMPKEERELRLQSFLQRLEKDLAERGRKSLKAELERLDCLLPGLPKLKGKRKKKRKKRRRKKAKQGTVPAAEEALDQAEQAEHEREEDEDDDARDEDLTPDEDNFDSILFAAAGGLRPLEVCNSSEAMQTGLHSEEAARVRLVEGTPLCFAPVLLLLLPGSAESLLSTLRVAFRSHIVGSPIIQSPRFLQPSFEALPREVPKTTFEPQRPCPRVFAASDFKVVPMEGKGYGVVAGRSVKAGEKLYEEPPALVVNSEDSMQVQLFQTVAAAVFVVVNVLLAIFGAGLAVPILCGAGGVYLWLRNSGDDLLVPDELKEQWEALPAEKRAALASLSDCSAGKKTLSGIIDTNAFSRGASATSSSLVVCPTLARLNHSCSPNCQQSWDGTSGTEKLYAMCDIREGEELCITYCDLRKPRADRKEELRLKYGFDCTCPACSSSDCSQSDKNRVAIARLEEELCREGPADPERGLRCAEQLLATIDEEGLSDKMLRGLACYEAMEMALRLGDEEAVKSWANKAELYISQARGAENGLAQEAAKCGESPKQHPLWAEKAAASSLG
ncbi:set5, partial [Symbiodinium necroappetens]